MPKNADSSSREHADHDADQQRAAGGVGELGEDVLTGLGGAEQELAATAAVSPMSRIVVGSPTKKRAEQAEQRRSRPTRTRPTPAWRSSAAAACASRARLDRDGRRPRAVGRVGDRSVVG